jgi:hypothetical protein
MSGEIFQHAEKKDANLHVHIVYRSQLSGAWQKKTPTQRLAFFAVKSLYFFGDLSSCGGACVCPLGADGRLLGRDSVLAGGAERSGCG